MGEMLSSSPSSQEGDLVSAILEINEVQSSIPVRIKCVSTLEVKVDDLLKVKRCTLVLTGHWANASLKERTEEQASSNHVTIQKVNDFR